MTTLDIISIIGAVILLIFLFFLVRQMNIMREEKERLIEERDNIDFTTEKGRKRIKEINDAIDKMNGLG